MKKSIYFVLAMAMVILASCGTATQPEQIKVNPSPLAVKGGKVEATITGTFPVKKFARRGVLTVTPVLKYEGGEAVSASVTYVGEKAKENGTTVSYRDGGKYSQKASFDFVPAMANSELYLRFEGRVGKKAVSFPDVKVADGVITTANIASAEDLKPVVTADKFQRIIQEVQEADIRFLIQQSNLRQSELNSQEMKDLHAAIKEADKNEKKEINKIEVSGYASPDGGLNLNEKLANARQSAAQKYLAKQLKRQKINQDIESNVTAEDWEGFQAALEKSNMADKALVLRVLSMYSDPEERENQIKNLSAVYKTLAKDILPELRRSRLILTTDLIGKSDEEISKLAKEDPAQLNVEELLYAATLVNTNDEKIAIYRKVADLYNDYRANNNQAVLAIEAGNYTEAQAQIEKALKLAANNADVNFNAALIAMEAGDLQKAEAYLGKAAGANGSVKDALGTLNIMKGDYPAATKAFSGEATNNAAVNQILNEDYAAARKTLKNVANPNATTYYLLAVVGARTNDREATLSNLKQAVAKCATLKVKAARDIEFAQFAETAEFQAIVK